MAIGTARHDVISRQLTLEGVQVQVTSYRIGERYSCTVDNIDPGAVIGRGSGPGSRQRRGGGDQSGQYEAVPFAGEPVAESQHSVTAPRGCIVVIWRIQSTPKQVEDVTMESFKPEGHQRRKATCEGWEIGITSYKLKDRYYCKIDNIDPGATIARGQGECGRGRAGGLRKAHTRLA